MISESVAVRQAMRFRSLRTREALSEQGREALQEEYIRVLQQHALSEDHAVRMVTRWLMTNPYAPTLADLVGLASATPLTDAKVRPDGKCSGCAGTGFERVWTLETDEKISDRGAILSSYRTKELITDPEIAADLAKRVNGRSQVLVPRVRHCTYCGFGKSIKEAAETRAPGSTRGYDDLPVIADARQVDLLPPEVPAMPQPHVVGQKRGIPKVVESDFESVRRRLDRMMQDRKQAAAADDPDTDQFESA